MVATVVIQQVYGAAPGTFSDRDDGAVNLGNGTRYMTIDSNDSSLTTHPIPIPIIDGGVSGSYWVTHCIHCTVAPDTYLKNLRYYQGDWSTGSQNDWTLGSSNTLPAGLYIGVSSTLLTDTRLLTQGFHSGQYDQADGVEGVHGYLLTGGSNGHTFYGQGHLDDPLSGGMVLVDNFDSLGNALMVQSGQIVGNATGRSYCIATQVLVGSGATAGNKTDKTATFVYSEA